MSDSRIKVEMSESGASVEASGEHANRVSAAILDLLSLFTEPAGWAGDIIRVRRQEWVLKALRAAKRIAADENIPLSKKSPKIIEQWVRSSSFSDNDYISEKWGRLLLSDSPPMAQLVFGEYLSKLGGDEARWLDSLWFKYNRNIDITELYNVKLQKLRKMIREHISGREYGEKKLDESSVLLYTESETLGILLRYLRYDALSEPMFNGNVERRTITHSWEPEILYPDIYASMGILRLDYISQLRKHQSGESSNIDAGAYFFTRIGSEFMRALSPAETSAPS